MSAPEQDQPATSSSFLSRLNAFSDRVHKAVQDNKGNLRPSELGAALRTSAVGLNPNQPAETLRLQLAIKAQGSVVRHEQALSRDTKQWAARAYDWSKHEENAEDIQDVTDRLAFLLYQTGDVHAAAAQRIEQSRLAFKDVRNFENELRPKCTRHDQLRASWSKLQAKSELNKSEKEQVDKLEAEADQLEKEIDAHEATLAVLKRKKLHESYTAYFAAQRELGEKLALIAGYGEVLLDALDGEPGVKYTRQAHTAQVRAEATQTLDSWTPGRFMQATSLSSNSNPNVFLGRSDTRSFGFTHRNELSQLTDSLFGPHITHDTPDTPPALPTRPSGMSSPPPPSLPPRPMAVPGAAEGPSTSQLQSPPAGPANGLNMSPAPISPVAAHAPAVPTSSPSFRPSMPTIESAGVVPGSTGPAPGRAGAMPGAFGSTPSEDSMLSTSAASGVEQLPASNAPPEPTYAETGAPVAGTGGPSSGQLRPRQGSNAQPIKLSSLGGEASPSGQEAGATKSSTGVPVPGPAPDHAAAPQGSLPQTGTSLAQGTDVEEEGLPPAYTEPTIPTEPEPQQGRSGPSDSKAPL